MVSKHRARDDDEKEARRRQILERAAELWDERTFATLTMAEVAARCGLAKGTLYLYFATKEELLLTLLEEGLGDWFDALDAALAGGGAWDATRVAEAIGAVTTPRVAMTRLVAIGDGILEHNIAADRVLGYKGWLLGRALATGALIETRLPALSPGEGTIILRRVHALVVGLRGMADPSPATRAVLARPELAPLRVAFGPELTGALAALLRGMAGEGREEGG